MIISIVGIFGLVIFETQYRRKEIGIRKVFGATVHEILVMFNKIYFRIVCVCFIIAAPLAYYGVRKWLEGFAYKTPILLVDICVRSINCLLNNDVYGNFPKLACGERESGG